MILKPLLFLCILYGTAMCTSFQSFIKDTGFSGTVSFLNDLDFGEVLNTLNCGRLCNSVSDCDGFYYNEINKKCQGYSSTDSDGSFFNVDYAFFAKAGVSMPAVTPTAPMVYIALGLVTSASPGGSTPPGSTISPGGSNPPGYQNACSVNSDCTIPNSICWSSKCECDPGYVLDSGTASCVTTCGVYGDTYIKYDNYSLALPTNRTEFNCDESECLQHCTDDPLCRSINLFNDMCIMKYFTVLGHMDKWMSISSMDHYVRNCA